MSQSVQEGDHGRILCRIKDYSPADWETCNLLKPINKEELESILRRLKDKLTQKEESVKNLEQLGSQLGTGKKKLKYYIAEQLMRENVAFLEQPIEEINNSYLTNFGDGIYQCIMLKIDNIGLIPDPAFFETLLVRMQDYCLELLKTGCKEYIIYPKESILWCYVCRNPEGDAAFMKLLKSILEYVRKLLEKFENLFITVLAGTEESSLPGLIRSKTHAMECLASRYALDVNKIITYDMVRKDSGTIAVIFPDTRKQKFKDAIKSMDQESIKKQTIAAFHMAEEYKYKNTLIFQEVYSYILELFYEYIHAVQIYKGTKEELMAELESRLKTACSGKELLKGTCAFLYDFIDNYVKEGINGESPAIRIAKRFIADNYQKNISLNSIAEIVHLNPVYFSILFKREEGVNFLDYLTQYRLDMAKELLKDVKYNVNQVANMTGFRDARYFSKIFKKSVGITPTEYRNRNIYSFSKS